MNVRSDNVWDAVNDFVAARQQAAMQAVMARLTGKSNELLSYEEVARKLKLSQGAETGRHDIPLDAIVGSVGRYSDFSRSFLPLQDSDRTRWVGVKTAMDSLTGVPPIDVYKVGEVYFVRDGNHRVSVAHALKWSFIDAEVVRVRTDAALDPRMSLKDIAAAARRVPAVAQQPAA